MFFEGKSGFVLCLVISLVSCAKFESKANGVVSLSVFDQLTPRLELAVIAPETPGSISGPALFPLGSSGLSYSIEAVENADSYTWTVPTGMTILSGQGSNTISVENCGTSLSGTVSVTADSTAGSSAAATLSVSGSDPIVNLSGQVTDMSSWTILASGGDGWRYSSGGFETSYAWDRKSQEVDLVAAGMDAEYLDNAPDIKIGENFARPGCCAQPVEYYLRVELRDAAHNPIVVYDSGYLNNTGGNLTHVFSAYGAGVRYLYWEDGGKDTNFWVGHFGAKIQNGYLRTGACAAPY